MAFPTRHYRNRRRINENHRYLRTTALQPSNPCHKSMCKAGKGEKLEIIMDNATAFNDMKEYLSEQQIGFREIYDGERMTLQFTMY